MEDFTPFAWRCRLIVPADLAPEQPWPDHNGLDPPRPPQRWRPQGYGRSWHSWRDARQLSDNQVIARDAISIVWCQRGQQYWVMHGDCTDRRASEVWRTLFCRDLQDSGKPGLWELLSHGIVRQHDSQCPEGFDEFLPKNFFMKIRSAEPCHFVGHLSLVLGLLAMCPREVTEIPRQIDEIFYQDDEPRFIPWYEHIHRPSDSPMDRFKYPGRAIVMQTGIINGVGNSEERRLRAWEKGDMGPMVSSHNPTPAQNRAWGSPPF